MIVIHGWADIGPERRDEVATAAAELQASSRTEPGCVHYGLSWALDDPNRICLVEVWKDAEAHRTHTTMPYVESFRDLAASASSSAPTFFRFDASEVTS